MEIILASKSPRRRELLSLVGFTDFMVIPSDAEENISLPDPGETVRQIALAKARDVSSRHPSALVIASDTLVFLDGQALGKPKDASDAKRMLTSLSGRRHEVFSGVALLKGGDETSFYEKTDVFFRRMTGSEIDAYIRSGEPMDKAGAYGAQGRGAVFIERIEGDFFNVMGLPVCRLVLALSEMGIPLPEGFGKRAG